MNAIFLLLLVAAASLLPGFIALHRRVRHRNRIRVLAAAGVLIPGCGLLLVAWAGIKSETATPLLIASTAMGLIAWVAALVWAMLGAPQPHEFRGFDVLPARPRPAPPPYKPPP